MFFRNWGNHNEDIILLPKAKTSINDFTSSASEREVSSCAPVCKDKIGGLGIQFFGRTRASKARSPVFISKTRNRECQREIWSGCTNLNCIGELWLRQKIFSLSNGLALLVCMAYSSYVCIAVPGYHTVHPPVFGSSSFQTNKGRQMIQCESLLKLSVLVN